MSGINPDLRPCLAFTLLEVVVAIGIFAVGMVAVIGLFGPVAKSVGDLSDAEAATHVAELLSVQLQAQENVDLAAGSPFKSFAARAKTDYDIATDAQLLFASRDGTKIGGYADPIWKAVNGANGDRDK